MGFGIRELLMLTGGLIFLGILVDGVRRFKNNRNKQIKIEGTKNSNKFEQDEQIDDWLTAELPKGKSRIRNIIHDDSELGNTGDRKAVRHFAEPVDILMENPSLRAKPHVNRDVDEDPENLQTVQDAAYYQEQFVPIVNTIFKHSTNHEDNFNRQVEGVEDELRDARMSEKPPAFASSQDLRPTQRKNTYPDSAQENTPSISAKKPSINQGDLFSARHESSEDEISTDDLTEEVLSVNVIAKKGQVIEGQALIDAAHSFGLRFGDMEIFHRHENASGYGPVIFSMANAINPGTFDIEQLPDMQIKGVTFFMRLSKIKKRVFVLELMLDIAKRLSNLVDAELKDDTHSVLSSQTVAHYKSRIQEYERRYLGQVLRK